MVIAWPHQSLRHNETKGQKTRWKKSSNLGMKRQPDHRTEIILSIQHSGLWCFSKPSSALDPGPSSTRKAQREPGHRGTLRHRDMEPSTRRSGTAPETLHSREQGDQEQQVLSSHREAQHVSETKPLFLSVPWRKALMIFLTVPWQAFTRLHEQHTQRWQAAELP